jgi:hypothetical protein
MFQAPKSFKRWPGCSKMWPVSNTDFLLWRALGLIPKPSNRKTKLLSVANNCLIHSQLLSISGGHFLKLQSEYVPCVKGLAINICYAVKTYNMGPVALLPLWRKSCCRFLLPLKIITLG